MVEYKQENDLFQILLSKNKRNKKSNFTILCEKESFFHFKKEIFIYPLRYFIYFLYAPFASQFSKLCIQFNTELPCYQLSVNIQLVLGNSYILREWKYQALYRDPTILLHH
ncbi:hypothetical protein A5844_002190 [Enterococcus sp. 10A9_DIV0425]|uniref:Uncharacterized protein n=1 Tax=Candidatus Enterococcus wittei TaxID=1987383 RepID=A0A242JZ44_9ENTE|nr:hypothetical protein A5844_002190 [Enterococcus sp. 10A9_DIV0425]